MITMKFAIFASALLCAGVLSAQKYSVTVETHIAGKPEDKFTFVIAEGGSQHKGFDGKVLAKRYMSKGYPAPSVNMEEYSDEVSETKKTAAVKTVKFRPLKRRAASCSGSKTK